MTLGLGRFEYYLIQLDEILLAACKTDNAALYLYENDARTKLFMLEGMCKLYAGLHNEKKFLKLKATFKALEDLIGSIDYYDSFSIKLRASKKIPNELSIALANKRDEKIAELNQLLLSKKWINHAPLRTIKIRKKLKKIKWQTPEKEIALIKGFYIKSIESIINFYKETGAEFTDIELQVHEIRRRLRWLSIYAQALQGVIQFDNKNVRDERIKKYLTPAIASSVFNKLPAKGKNVSTLLVKKNYFLALSYVINELGIIKDNGLKILATKEALQSKAKIIDKIALQRALQLHNLKADGLIKIMKKAHGICEIYFKEQSLEKMIV
jgi:hypothetical protein